MKFSSIHELIKHPNHIDLVNDQLKALAQEKPDFTYCEKGNVMGCFYDRGPNDEEPSDNACIFGQAFQRLGIPRSTLDGEHGDRAIVHKFVRSHKSWVWVQEKQDRGQPWKEAITGLDLK